MDPNLEIRLERARSWSEIAGSISLSESRRISDDTEVISGREHERFIFYWIALNCLYGRQSKNDQDNPDREKTYEMKSFLGKVARMSQWDLDEGTCIFQIAMDDPDTKKLGETLILDFFLDRRYWDHRFHLDDLKGKIKDEWVRVEASVTAGSYHPFLTSSLERLKVLRNQIMHGSVTYGSKSKGWKSLQTGVLLIARLVPALVELVSKYGDRLPWDPAPYPRFGYPGHPRQSSFTIKR